MNFFFEVVGMFTVGIIVLILGCIGAGVGNISFTNPKSGKKRTFGNDEEKS